MLYSVICGREFKKMTFQPREYQERALDLLQSFREKQQNVLLELDCGLGKRFITYQLVESVYPDTRFVILVHSTSSLDETTHYLSEEYGGVTGFGWLNNRTPSRIRAKILEEKRVIVSTPQILVNTLNRNKNALENANALLINEVDKLVRRMGHRRVLIHPWRQLLEFFADQWVVGMSGTLRDSHVIFDDLQLQIRGELETLREFIPRCELITMEDFAGTDVDQFVAMTDIRIQKVDHPVIQQLCEVMDKKIKEVREQIFAEIREEEPGLIEKLGGNVYQLVTHLPASTELRQQYMGLTLLRKYLFSMTTNRLKKHLWRLEENALKLDKLPAIPPKIMVLPNLVNSSNKSVILCSYIDTVKQITEYLSPSKQMFNLTGRIIDKNKVLAEFKACDKPACLVISPVGERDLDIPQADLLILYDVVNTVKTVYQRLKRIRKGNVVILCYGNTSEEKKVGRLLEKMVSRYPWSLTTTNNI